MDLYTRSVASGPGADQSRPVLSESSPVQSTEISHWGQIGSRYFHPCAQPVWNSADHRILQHFEPMRIISKKIDFHGECKEWQLECPVASEMCLEEAASYTPRDRTPHSHEFPLDAVMGAAQCCRWALCLQALQFHHTAKKPW
jgi:hypothetical protein